MRPQPIAEILSDLLARRGYAREQAASAWSDAWSSAAGEWIAGQSRVGRMRGGKLEVFVANSTLAHELTFRKAEILDRLARLMPGESIVDLKFRVGAVK